MTKLQILRCFYETVWERGEVEQIDRFFGPELEASGWFPGLPVGVADFPVLVLAIRSMVHDIKFTIVRLLVHDDWVAALVQVDCTSRGKCTPIRITGQLMARFDGDLIVEAHNHMDMFGYFVQLGMLPEDLTLKLLAGEDAA